jgi:MotA/TolQ/ExbB proton channel family
MSSTPPVGSPPRTASRSSATLQTFVIGVPMAVGLLGLIKAGPLHDSSLARYVHHPVEMVEVLLFCCAMAALLTKLLAGLRERAASRLEPLPSYSGQPVPVADAHRLRAKVLDGNASRRDTYLFRRVDAVLDFVGSRGSAQGIDDQLRALADSDAIAQENSYALIRFITWAIPILGFLGTVLGITGAIAGVTPEVLEKNLSAVTDGLSVAFDSTAVALALTMLTMFLSFLTERLEQGVLETVDHYVDVQLAHRFEQHSTAGGEFIDVVRQNTQVLLQATDQIVQRQAAVWTTALTVAQQQWNQASQHEQQHLAGALEQALECTLQTHQQRLMALEQHVENQSGALLERLAELAVAIQGAGRQQEQSLGRVLDAVTAQTEALARLQDDGKQLVRLQDALHHNLAALNNAGSFEQAVHTLTAAIHLLTAKVIPGATGPTTSRLGQRPGTAA